MDTRSKGIATLQRRALDFMLDTLGLQRAEGEGRRAARLLELEQQVGALLTENRGLRLRVVQLERALNPDEAELDALERATNGRLAGERERRLDDI
jgi:hypothetical protein